MSQFRSPKTMPPAPTYFPNARGFTISGGTFGDDHRTYKGPIHHFHGYDPAATAHINQPAGTQTPSYYPQPYQAEPTRTSSLPSSTPSEHEFIKPHYNPSFNNSHPQRRLGSTDDEQHDNLDEWLPPHLRAKMTSGYPHSEQRNRQTSMDEERQAISPKLEQYIRELERQRNDKRSSTKYVERDLQDRLKGMQIDDDNAQPSVQSSSRVRPKRSRGNMKQGAKSRSPEPEDGDSDDDIDDKARNVGSNNVSRTTIVDSYNDNSTRNLKRAVKK